MTARDSTDRLQRTAACIEAAAIELFAAKGFHEVSLDDVAAAVGVHVRTVHRHFRTKDELLLVLPRREGRAITAELLRRPPDESPVEAMCQAVATTVAAREGSIGQALRWAQAVNSCPDVFLAVSAEQMHEMADAIVVRIGDSQPPEVAKAVARAIAGALHGMWREWVNDGGAGDYVESVARGLRVLERLNPDDHEEQAAEIARLRAENAELRVERELFKRAAAALLPADAQLSGGAGNGVGHGGPFSPR